MSKFEDTGVNSDLNVLKSNEDDFPLNSPEPGVCL